MSSFRVYMQRIGGDTTMMLTIEATDIFAARWKAIREFGSHYRLIHIGECYEEKDDNQ